MDAWIAEHAELIAARAPRELEALVGVSSPSGDVAGADEAVAVAAALLPDGVLVERVPCSTPGHAADLVAHLPGTGTGRVLLLGHLDTVISHSGHRPLVREGEQLVGSGSIDMKGGVVLALGVLRALAADPSQFADLVLLLVVDEEWRTAPFAHVERFAGFDACLCFEAGELSPDGDDAVVVERKAAGTIKVRGIGRSAHSGSAPDKGSNALLALAEAARAVAACHAPQGPQRLTAVPTILRSGDAFNVVPSEGELICDVRATSSDAFAGVMQALPREVGGARLESELVRVWPGMSSWETAQPVLEAAQTALGRPIVGARRGGASDASHFAATVPVTIDGLGPRGGGAHAPHEFVLESSLRTRAEVALAVARTCLLKA